MKLTLRQTDIIKIILNSEMNSPCNIQFISEQLDISTRTVLRELSVIEDWFKENNLLLVKKAGVGIYWDKNCNSKKEVITLLQDALASKEYSKEERKRYIIKEIIYTHQPIKSNYFLIKLGISSKTFKLDMNGIAKWLEYYGILLINKPAIGISILEDERNIRKAIIGLIYEIYGDELFINLLKIEQKHFVSSDIKKSNSHNKINCFEFINLSNINKIKEIMLPIRTSIHCTDGAYINILIYLLVLVNRIQNNFFIETQSNECISDDTMKYFLLARKIAIYLEKQFNCITLESEIIYLANYLATLDLNFEQEFNIKINQDVKELIFFIQNKTNIKFELDENLANDLIHHLKFSIPRLERKISVQNFHINFLKQNYSEIFEATKESLDIILKRYNIYDVPDEEIAFITMHFGNSAEKMFENYTLRVVLICPSGIGTAKMLKTSLNKTFSFFEIVNTLSIIDLDIEKLKREHVSLIISTVQLELDFPTVKVNPILSAQDKINLRNLVKDLATFNDKNLIVKKNMLEQKVIYNSNIPNIREITQYGLEIINIIDSVFLYKSNLISSKYEMIQKVATLIGKTNQDIIEISEKLVSRERITSTYLKQFNVYLFHCKTVGVKDLRFGFIKLTRTFQNSTGDVVKGALVLLIPQNANKIYVDIASAISGHLAEEAILEKIIHTKTKFDISNIIEDILSRVFIDYINETGE